MDRPEKLIVELVVNNPVATARLRGYNDAIDDYEAWLKEVASIDKIQEVMEKVDSDYKSGKTSSMHMAKTIHKLIEE